MQYSIVNTSNLDNIVFRLDAEFYHPSNLALESKLSNVDSISIRDASGKIDCSAFYPSIVPYYNFEYKGIPFLRVNEIQNGLLHITNDTAFLPEHILDANKSTIAKCYPGDLIIAKGGNSLAKVALLTDEYPVYSICRDLIVIRTNDLKYFNKYYIWMFFHSKIGKQLLLRTASQTGQPHLTVEALYEIKIPKFSPDFQNYFQWLYQKSEDLKEASRQSAKSMDKVLIHALGLSSYNPSHSMFFTKSYVDTLDIARLDAEYFQPKYLPIHEAISKFPHRQIGDFENFDITTGQYCANYVSQEDGFPYIRGTDLDNGIVNIENLKFISPSEQVLEKKAEEGDVVVTRVGTIGLAARIPTECSAGTISDNLIRIRILSGNEIDSYYLACFLGSSIGKALMIQKGRGSVQQRLNQETLKEIPLPIIDSKIQNKIKSYMQQSFNYRKNAHNLLEFAKISIEKAIFDSQEESKVWLSKTIDQSFYNI
ncbi:MAG: restriction endonuclease subunit S [Spirochaetia bacterium]|nr:restriction endonuclease subunit S [Spirochaetia bacterium]